MNFNFYIFGNPAGQYSQYPQDYAKDILAPLCDGLHGARAVIYRHSDLMHYIYVERLDETRYIGLCLIFNRLRCRHPKKIFEFLRSTIENKALKSGKFIAYGQDGDIVFTKDAFCEDVKAYDYLKSLINSALENRNDFGLEELQTNYNGINKTEYVDWEETNRSIISLSERCNRIVIEDSAGIEKNSTHQIISALQGQIAEKETTINELKNTVSSLEKQKKQYRKVIILFSLVLLCCGGLYFLYDSLSRTEDDLRETVMRLNVANDTISANRKTISRLRNEISSLNSSLQDERRLRSQAEERLDRFKSAASFIITGGSYSFSNNEYRCTYFATEAGTRSFRFKVIEESSGNTYTTKDITPYLEEGAGSFTVYFNRRMNSSNWYVFEIWQGNRLVGGSRH